jgi:DNA-binding response OmpR family regulator
MDNRRDTVLVVDDSPDSLGFVTEALKKTGIAVLVATSGEAALSICERVTPDTILMDAVMPGLDGFETCRKLKENQGLQHVPVIFMTGLSETEHIVKALDCGGVDFLTKPIDVDELKARIKVHLRNARSVQSAHVALDAAGRHLVAVSSEGAILWTTRHRSTPFWRGLALQMQRFFSWAERSANGLRAVQMRHGAAASCWACPKNWPSSSILSAALGRMRISFA